MSDANAGAGVVRHPRPGGTSTRLRRAGTAVVLGLAGLVGLPVAAAQAHPLGPPQQVSLALSAPDRVQAIWKAGADDDLSWLAFDLGLLPEDRVMLDGAITPSPADEELLKDSPRFDDYLTTHMAISTPAGVCRPELVDKLDLRTSGAALDFSCPSPVTTATVELSLLTDLEVSYTTVATGPDGQTSAFNGNAPSHDFRFDPARITAPAIASATHPAAAWWGLTALIPLVAGGTIWLARRRGRVAEGSA